MADKRPSKPPVTPPEALTLDETLAADALAARVKELETVMLRIANASRVDHRNPTFLDWVRMRNLARETMQLPVW